MKFKNQQDLFKWIWENRERKSIISGVELHEMDVWCFAHVLPKGRYPAYKLNPDNVQLITRQEHINLTDRGISWCMAQSENYQIWENLFYKLKAQYYNDTRD